MSIFFNILFFSFFSLMQKVFCYIDKERSIHIVINNNNMNSNGHQKEHCSEEKKAIFDKNVEANKFDFFGFTKNHKIIFVGILILYASNFIKLSTLFRFIIFIKKKLFRLFFSSRSRLKNEN